jgi:transposase
MYPSDLSDAQWAALVEHCPFLIEPDPRGGRPRWHAVRLMLDAVLSVDKTGCQGRQLPREYPPWKTVYGTFRRWRLNGTWNRVHAVSREVVRRRAGKLAHRRWPLSIRSPPRRRKKGEPRLRRRQEGERPQAAHRGRYPGVDLGRSRNLSRDSGSDGGSPSALASDHGHPPDPSRLCRWGLQRHPARLGQTHVPLDLDHCEPPECQAVRSAALALVGRADFRLAQQCTPLEQRLRVPSRDLRMLYPDHHDFPHASASLQHSGLKTAS